MVDLPVESSHPFPVSGYDPGARYCEREEETIRLITQINSRVNTILVGVPRIGKTTLLQQVMRSLESQYGNTCLYLDILLTENILDLARQFNSIVERNFPEKPEKNSRIDSEPEAEHLIHSLFEFLERRRQKIVICIDDFQQVMRYADHSAITLIRSATLRLKNVCFVFGCQNEYLLNDFFDDATEDFFTNFDLVHLDPIRQNAYAQFIRESFGMHGRSLSAEAVSFILDWTRRHTYYTQALCRRLFDTQLKEIELEHVHEECGNILTEHSSSFAMYRNLLSPVQWLLLKAIAREEKVHHPTAKQFLMQHGIGTPANVQRALEALLSKEMVVALHDEKGRYYQVFDCFLSRWLEGLD